jgi:PAS domain S-box-containing protein
VRSLELGKERYKDTLNQSPFGVVVIHDNYTIDFANKKILQWLGWEFKRINNQSILELCSYGSRNLLQQKLDKSTEEDTTQVLNARFIKSDKQEISFKITITEIDWRKKELERLESKQLQYLKSSMVSDSQVMENNTHGILLFFEDISEIEAYQRKLLEKNLEFDQRNKMQEGIIRSYHHDIRGFCTSINSVIKTFLLPQAIKVNTPQFIKDIEGVAENARLLIRTVDDLRDLAREGRSSNLEEEVQLRNTIEYVKKGLSSDLKSASATVNIPPKFPLVKVIRAEFTQIFSNLISNSLKFRSSYRKLVIDITYSYEEGNELIIEFADNGIGIEADKLGLIFNGHRFNNNIEGDGIGLSQVQSIVKNYGGSVEAESEGIEKGLTITMSFNDDIIVKAAQDNKNQGEAK